jgi:putative lipoprotein
MRGILLAFTLHFGRTSAGQANDPWFGTDKAQHFFISAFVESVTFSGLRATRLSRTGSLVGASIMTSAIGITKEIHDARSGGDPSAKDLMWDGAGIVAAGLLLGRTQP